jgi:hypothetical protein
VEGAHIGHPDFRVKNRIFATLHDDGEFGMVKLTPEQQEQCMRSSRRVRTRKWGVGAGWMHAGTVSFRS